MLITVFTPTYNREHLLPRLYESLCKQGFVDFEWLIVDDGSQDETKKVIERLAEDNQHRFEIRYIYKDNGGKHTAVNLGTQKAKGELFFIADSDDVLTDDALEVVVGNWQKVKEEPIVAGVAGLDIDRNTHEVIGSGLSQEAILCDAMAIRYQYYVKGDLKEVFRTSVLRQFPFPEIPGERFCPEQLCWFRIAQHFKLYYFNTPIYCVEYQKDGITSGITKARMNSPKASMMTYAELATYRVPLKERIKAAINYWRFRCCKHSTHQFPRLLPIFNVFAPLGWLMHLKDLRY